MKYYLIPMFAAFLFFANTQKAEAQFLKKLKKNVEHKVNNEAEERTNRRTDNAVDKVFDKAEGLIDKAFGKKNKKKGNSSGNNSDDDGVYNDENGSSENSEGGTAKPKGPNVVWSKFDFIPGETVIFEDGPDKNEENGEFPSRWDLYKGNAEIGEVDGENVIMFLQGGIIVPYLKNSNEDYLPEIFTIEFDVYFKPGDTYKRYWVNFYDKKNQSRISDVSTSLEVYVNGLEFGASEKRYPGTEMYNWGRNPVGGWKHISVAYTKGKFKAYMDDTRLINIPHLEGNPVGITLQGENADEMMYLKNVRIAKGGVKYYDRVLSDGKIIVNGIKFDVNKATLKPESMGPINKIYQLMVKNPDLKFSVEGHTDADGGEAENLKLSKARGKTVMDKLISMGISPDRLKYDGFGESKPIDNNSTPEGKANNRRVEFVKF